MGEPEKQSGFGGRRPGAGRPKGKKNAATLEIEAAARAHAGDAIKALVHVALKGKSEPARVSAATALLDRGYGKPKQSLEHSGGDGGPVEFLVTRRVVHIENRVRDAFKDTLGANGNGNGHP